MQKFINTCFSNNRDISCNDSSSGENFSITGTIKNNSARMIYLEEVRGHIATAHG